MTDSAEALERDPVAEAARDAFARADGDVATATRIMEQAVRSNRTLRDEITEPLLAGACYAAVRSQCRAARGRVWRTSRRELARQRTEGARRLMNRAETLLSFPLLGGRLLRDAKQPEIRAAAEFFTRQAGDMAEKGRFLRLVAERIPPARAVGEVLTEAQLRDLREEACAHA